MSKIIKSNGNYQDFLCKYDKID